MHGIALQALLFVAAFEPPGAVEEAAPAEPASPDTRRIHALVIRSAGAELGASDAAVDADALRSALELRAPGRRISILGEPGAGRVTGPWALLDIRPDGGGVAMSVILEDGRAFDRQVDVEPEEAPRAIAATLSNLLAAIEDERVVADREDVERPALPEEPPEQPPPAEPEPPPEPSPAPPPKQQPKQPPEPPPEDPPTPLSLGLALTPGVVFGLGQPSDPGALVAGGGALGLDLKLPVGVLVGAGVRGATRVRSSYRLDRLRVGLGVGYRLRARAFELNTRLLATVESWRLVEPGESTVTAGGERVGAVALGGALRLEPGVWFTARPRLDVRMALWTELALSGSSLDDEFSTAHIRDNSGASLFRIGGASLGVGFAIGLWFDVPRKRAR